MYSVDGTTIHLIRGDTMRLEVSLTKDGEIYTPMSGDVIRFAMKKTIGDTEPLILKTVPHDTMMLVINPQDTKNLSFGKYIYDMEITLEDGTVDTFIPFSEFYIDKEVY